MKRLASLLLLTGALSAETVYLVEDGRTYHATTRCAALGRSAEMYQVDRAALKARKPCQRCYRPAKASKLPAGAAKVAK